MKSASRKFALFVRLGGEGKAHTYDKGCSQQLRAIKLIQSVRETILTDNEFTTVAALAWDTQLIAVRFLTEIGSASALPALKKALSHDQWEVTRAAALDGMFIISPSEARSCVAAALTDGSAVVRQHARNLR